MDDVDQPEDLTAKDSSAGINGETNGGNTSTPSAQYSMTENSLSPYTAEERTWAMMAHLSMLLNLFTGLLGPIIALVIYFAYKDRSRYVAYQAMQSFLFQLLLWIGAGVVITGFWVLTAALTVILIGLCLVPIGIVISCVPLAAVVYSVIGGFQCNQGQDFRYWLVSDLTDSFLTQN